MAKRLRSVGLDVGTTTTQMIVSQLTVENRAGAFAVPRMEISRREVLYRSPVHFTPLLDETHVDGAAIRELVEQEYRAAGLTPDAVDTGAIIITGETARKKNARTVLRALERMAGEFVVATAGPDLESILAARGAGAVQESAQSGKTVLHIDIGGGTSNLALIRAGKVVDTGCLNVGGRLLKFDADGRVRYVSPAVKELCKLKAGDRPEPGEVEALAKLLAQALEIVAGLRRGQLPPSLLTQGTAGGLCRTGDPDVELISFSGGVADCIASDFPANRFGDLGPVLGREIRRSRLCQGAYRLGAETIRATVIGAGCHSAQLSGSTVFYRDVTFPLKNLPVVTVSKQEQCAPDLQDCIRQRLAALEDGRGVLALPGFSNPSYSQLTALADALARGLDGRAALICVESDMAKALGHCLCLRLSAHTPILCIDRVQLEAESYLDVGSPVDAAIPVVVKTLVLSAPQEKEEP